MKKKIDNPKVFISYAWGSKEYEDKVFAFASKLREDGIDVIFDKWDLTEGNDTYAFMEKCVADPSVTNVLMLLDPVYTSKADDRAGGVGTETQIISAEIYENANQEKFIPVITERDTNGNICKPIYLKSRLHIDLSDPIKYDTEYIKLVKRLYGEEIYIKPELGIKPNWVEKPIIADHRSMVLYDSLKNQDPPKVKEMNFKGFSEQIKKRITEYAGKDSPKPSDSNEYIEAYKETGKIKEDFLQLMKHSYYVDNSRITVADFFEDTKNELCKYNNSYAEIASILIHELFLYVIAYYLKNEEYSDVGYLLGKTYFDQNQNVTNYHMFYSVEKRQGLDNAMNLRDNKKHFTGTGKFWIETLAVDFCSKENFILADLICYNYSNYGKRKGQRWFPLIYIYDDMNNSVISNFTRKMVSKEYVSKILPIFGYQSIEEFQIEIQRTENNYRTYDNCRYESCFDSAPTLNDFIKASDVAKLN